MEEITRILNRVKNSFGRNQMKKFRRYMKNLIKLIEKRREFKII